ncbi:hypothetical protein OG2516_06222 [Oceanicola granulosus HTCC2516]|uniref:Uncharacterized protein n=1 Tax=Oceanicola granulosus (strain ATCC BAA-861 / DSM 15982 / KCTC 12143 / HTCC2516) TaxID=314256 RepID=Q2CDC0_OCEGH|nr:hypothetical protein [Oceanicola granulosus]EAR50670.1 hypothetical protein OG2516_06222 [Oceanicola granulosus HTCC2516]
MRSILTLPLAALLALGLPGTAPAQEIDVETETNDGVFTGAQSAFTSFGGVVSWLRSPDLVAGDVVFEDVDADSEFTILRLSELRDLPPEAATELDEALAEAELDLAEYRDWIAEQDLLVAALEAEGFTPDQVLAWETHFAGDVTFVVDDRS